MASSDVSSVVNHFSTAAEGFTTTLSSTASSGATTLALTSTSGLTNGKIFVGIIEPGTVGKEQTFTGVVDTGGNQITGVKWTRGSNTGHNAGVTIVDYVSGTAHNMMTKGLLVQHKQDGTHANTITTDTINENTAANGVTVDGLNIKDSKLTTANSVVTANITDAAVTPAKLALSPQSSIITTQETTTSTSYVAMSTAQAITVTVGANGLLLVSTTVELLNSTTQASYVTIVLSGANTIAAADSYGVNFFGTNTLTVTRTSLLTGLTPGSTTITLNKRVSGGTGTFRNRDLMAIPL